MESTTDDTQVAVLQVAAEERSTSGLPLIALGLDLVPVAILWLGWYRLNDSGLLGSVLLFIAAISPMAAIIMGFVYLSRGKKRTGIAGRIVAIAAIALPLALVAFVLFFFIGVATGIISLM
ncbi:MAG: hypothetical protein FWG47_02835 [Propionibacteriaceae bacterium]|nr:hypothetical protein [Propionibacteriaceae bacterium]